MLYKGIIKELKKLVVSDPNYKKDVWCRYENNNLHLKNCNVLLEVERYKGNEDGYVFEGIDIRVIIFDSKINCELIEGAFTSSEEVTLKEYTIGMDSACVAIGANDIAELICSQVDEWQPCTCLRTLTDGLFGTVYEGKTPRDRTDCIYFDGFLDADTGYSVDDIVKYLEHNLLIKDLKEVI